MRKPVLSDINGIPVKRTMNLFGDPMSWFSNYVSFDFFVDYKRQQLGTKEAWIKIILEPGDIVNEHNIQETAKQFIDWTLAGILWERYGFSFHQRPPPEAPCFSYGEEGGDAFLSIIFLKYID